MQKRLKFSERFVEIPFGSLFESFVLKWRALLETYNIKVSEGFSGELIYVQV